MGTMICRG